jgi:hypothetical protein
MKTIRSGDALQSSTTTQADLSMEPDSKPLNKAGMRRRSRPDLITPFSSTHGKVSTNKGSRYGPSQVWLVQEKKVRDRDTEKRRRGQNEVSTVCFSIDVCLLDKQQACITKQFQTSFLSHLQL